MFGECHAHIFMDGNNYKQAAALHANHVEDSIIHKHFESYQHNQIRFIRDGGDHLGVSARAKELAPQYEIDYRTPIYAIHKNGCYGTIVGRGFDTLEEYKQLVLEAKDRGADFIKIMTTGLMDFNLDGSITGTDLPYTQVREMIAIAHEEGLSVMSHTNGAHGVMTAVSAGADSIEHGNFINRECISLMAESDVIWVPTVTIVPNMIGCGRFDDQVLHRIWEKSAEAIALAFHAQVRLALGSDAGAFRVFHGRGLLDELACFKKIIADEPLLLSRLADGEAFIQERFSR